ncbi:MAG: flagellar hook-basal body complex protein FliE [Gemmataceae bacterium]|nr:flagellar hook-basal body complex protein FliE [Gemmataceae bacterium]
MPVDSLGPIGSLPRLPPLAAAPAAQAAGGGFAGVLNQMLARNTQANEAANAAIQDLATGQAQDLHTVTMAVAQADTSFRLILELRNRLADAFQEVTRMQV